MKGHSIGVMEGAGAGEETKLNRIKHKNSMQVLQSDRLIPFSVLQDSHPPHCLHFELVNSFGGERCGASEGGDVLCVFV